MKSILVSIKPEWCEKIASGEKTIEVRKTRPKIKTPFKVYIYCTQDKSPVWLYDNENGNVLKDGFRYSEFLTGKVVGEFVCDDIIDVYPGYNGKTIYGWHISDLQIYDEPKSLSDFTHLQKTKFGYAPRNIKRAPQSWCYVEEQ